MRRREFITLLAGATAWPLAARAQQPGKVLRIGYLGPATGRSPVEDAFEEGLQQHGCNAKDQGTQALYVWPSGFTFSFAKQIADIANAHGLPSCHSFREGALAGGLLAYAADLREEARRGAAYVDKILRGTPPGNLPVEQLSKYELLINLRTSKALGLTVPPNLLATADEVIE